MQKMARDARAVLGYLPPERTILRPGQVSTHWLKSPQPQAAPITQKGSLPIMSTQYTSDEIKGLFKSCSNQTALEGRLKALVAQYHSDQPLVQRFRSIAGQIKPTLPEQAIKASTSSGPQQFKAPRPADLDPAIWDQWLTLPVKEARGHLSRFHTELVAHDATGLDKSSHGEYRKGSDGHEYFYVAPKPVKGSAPRRISLTPAQEVAAYRAAQDKSAIELTMPAYGLLARSERTVYAQAHQARLLARREANAAKRQSTKVEAKAEAQVAAGTVAFVKATAPAPVAPVATVTPRNTLAFVK